MYDMYPWDSRVEGSDASDTPPDPATQAVQVALDLRDNGGAAALNAKEGAALAGRAPQ